VEGLGEVPMQLFAHLFEDLLLFVYHCFDRVVIHGYLSGLSRPEQAVYSFGDGGGERSRGVVGRVMVFIGHLSSTDGLVNGKLQMDLTVRSGDLNE
jgi:hypothetical protein